MSKIAESYSKEFRARAIGALRLQADILKILTTTERLSADGVRRRLSQDGLKTRRVRHTLEKLVDDGELSREKNTTANVIEYWSATAVNVVEKHRHSRWVA